MKRSKNLLKLGTVMGLVSCIRRLCGLCICTALASCMVGPDYRRPVLEPGASYINADNQPELFASTSVVTQDFSSDRDIPARWWTEFNSPEVDRLVEEAIVKNPDLASARAALRAAHATLAAQSGVLFPAVDAGFSTSRQRNSATLASPLNSNVEDYSLYTGQINITYAPDVFGGIHRQIETCGSTGRKPEVRYGGDLPDVNVKRGSCCYSGRVIACTNTSK